jgi:hypothetical protein
MLLNRKIKGQHHDTCPNQFDDNLRAIAVTSKYLQIIASFHSALITDTGLVFG